MPAQWLLDEMVEESRLREVTPPPPTPSPPAATDLARYQSRLREVTTSLSSGHRSRPNYKAGPRKMAPATPSRPPCGSLDPSLSSCPLMAGAPPFHHVFGASLPLGGVSHPFAHSPPAFPALNSPPH